MALDAEYFDAIDLEVAKKKYYNANKVNAVLEDIRRQAVALNAENAALRRQLSQVNDRRVELGDALLSAQTIYQEVVDRAKARAREILAEALERREQILQETQRQQDYSVSRVEEAFGRLKKMHLDSIDAINAEWQGFLCGLYPEAEEPAEEKLPEDLEEKLDAIAGQMLSLEEEE